MKYQNSTLYIRIQSHTNVKCFWLTINFLLFTSREFRTHKHFNRIDFWKNTYILACLTIHPRRPLSTDERTTVLLNKCILFINSSISHCAMTVFFSCEVDLSLSLAPALLSFIQLKQYELCVWVCSCVFYGKRIQI